MLLLSVVLFLGIVAGIIVNMMASFSPFLNQMNNIQNYYNSYYGAVSALEQGLLAAKYKSAGFEGKGTGNISGDRGKNISKIRLKNITWSVNSKTQNITDDNINYLYGDDTSSGKTELNYDKVAVFSLTTGEKITSENSQIQINKRNGTVPKSLKYKGRLDEYANKNITTGGWINKSGFNMVVEDKKLYLWLDESFTDANHHRLPLLEYLLKFNKKIGDKRFIIKGLANAKDYTTELIIYRPTKDIVSPGFKKTIFPTKLK